MKVKAAYLQAKGFGRDIYVFPPQEYPNRTVLRKPTAATYGLVDSGQLWYLTSDSSITETFGAKKSRYKPILYYRLNDYGDPSFLLVPEVDNYIYCGTESEIKWFEKFLHEEYQLSEFEQNTFQI